MGILLSSLSALFCFVLILYSCVLFTNAVECLGKQLNIGDSATGSIFAALGTTLPETIVPLVAIIGGFITGNMNLGKQVGEGAVLGSPFMLSTITLFVIFIAVCLFYFLKVRKTYEINSNITTFTHDIKYFMLCYSLAVLAGFLSNKIKYIIAFVLLFIYALYFKRTLSMAGTSESEKVETLVFSRFGIFKNEKILLFSQIVISILMLVFSSHFLVIKIECFSEIFKINPFILSFIVMPFATELPETINSILWVRESKDTLAISNITGALVFQSCIPLSIGILFTPWAFDKLAILNVIFVYIMSAILFLNAKILKKICLYSLFLGGILYSIFILKIIYS